jgi:hypothetical protein
VTGKIDIGGELFGNSPTGKGCPYEAGFNLDLIYSLSDKKGILFAAGRSMRSDVPFTLYVGLQILTKSAGN